MNPERFVARLGEARASAILRCPSREAAASAMEAAVRGGFRIVEFTLTIPGALDLVEEFARREELIVGAGTVLTTDEARAAVKRGARFLVSPVMDPAVIAAGLAAGVAVIPGCHTPTEMLAAHRAGAPLQKLFPAPGIGPAYVRACLGPLPFLKLVPTHGIDAANARAWLDAGAFALGFTQALFDAEEIKGGRFDRVEERARALLAAVR
ncbi:MAG TPA: bifunctional 4-hydroxy-2-oxoglutarate aldolase/2-dehydro-3-deoxy-phosphogluconate aldolase [Candidatus Polarisedimenticolia bacterium]|jgi:Entner-Doudoroff aldolase|nr:bifunctional 4-hydroxy-2-oxoglutarate aldolase/2-dehydro-3-deoxy-phosphogluconate aldolase [Candidatus Polarisedimenticolia bacterium]